jgi:hypothetical protein
VLPRHHDAVRDRSELSRQFGNWNGCDIGLCTGGEPLFINAENEEVESFVLDVEAAFHQIWVSEDERRFNVAPLKASSICFFVCCSVRLLAQVYGVGLLRSLGEVVRHGFRLRF